MDFYMVLPTNGLRRSKRCPQGGLFGDGWGWMGFYSKLIFNENPPSNLGDFAGGSFWRIWLTFSMMPLRLNILPTVCDCDSFHASFKITASPSNLPVFWRRHFKTIPSIKLSCVKNLGLSLPVGKWRLKGITKKHDRLIWPCCGWILISLQAWCILTCSIAHTSV